MNVKLITLLASLCLALGLIIAGEWLYARQTQAKLLAPAAVKPDPAEPEALPGVSVAAQSEDSYTALILKPLFIKGRKPVDEPDPEESRTAVPESAFDWELSGIYGKNGRVSALVSRGKVKVIRDNHRRIRIGAELDGWKLADIQNDRVILMRGDARKELLLRKPKPKQVSGRPTPSGADAQPNATPRQPSSPRLPPPPQSQSQEEPFENNVDEQQF